MLLDSQRRLVVLCREGLSKHFRLNVPRHPNFPSSLLPTFHSLAQLTPKCPVRRTRFLFGRPLPRSSDVTAHNARALVHLVDAVDDGRRRVSGLRVGFRGPGN